MRLSEDPALAAALRQTRCALDRTVNGGASPGVQYALGDACGLLFEHAAGWAEFATARAVTPATTFNAYSIAKTLTAASLVLLAARCGVDLDAPIEALLGTPQEKGFGSLRQVLLHRGGYPNPNPLRWVHLDDEHAAFDEAAFAAGIATGLARPRRVGRRYAYSNLGYLMLGQVVARVSGLPLPQFVQRELVEPLSLRHDEQLSYRIERPEHHAGGYMKRLGLLNLMLGAMADRARLIEGAEGRWLRFRRHHVHGAAYGGLIANARGLVHYGRALLGADGAYPAALRQAMLSCVPGPGPERSLGWFSGLLQGQRWFAHAGGGPAYYGELRLYPQLRMVSAVLFNRPGLRDERRLDAIDAPLLSALRH